MEIQVGMELAKLVNFKTHDSAIPLGWTHRCWGDLEPIWAGQYSEGYSDGHVSGPARNLKFYPWHDYANGAQVHCQQLCNPHRRGYRYTTPT